MKILIITSEFEPLTNVGGLGEVTASLSRELTKIGCEIKTIIPYYKNIKTNIKSLKIEQKTLRKDLTVCIDWLPYNANIKQIDIEGIDCYLIDNKSLYDRNYIYNTDNYEEGDDEIRFGFLSLSAFEISKIIGFQPDIIHCHDWQTAFAPLFLKWRKHLKDDPFFKSSKIIYTIHNLSYQGEFDKNTLDLFGLPDYLYTTQNIELNGKINIMKAGILFSDLITTVSENYSKEILNPEFGFGMDRILRTVNQDTNKLHGILNGIDYDQWNPKSDKHIFKRYDLKNIDYKQFNKDKLISEFNLIQKDNKPLIGFISKLTDQKGIQLFIESIPQIIDLGFQIFVLGVGDAKYHKTLLQQRSKYRENLQVLLKQDEIIARKIYSGADFILMPSKFEPCGLAQMIALRYGTIPVVRGTGGLSDTVKDYNESNKPTGFVFKQYSKVNLLDTLVRAITVYEHKNEWKELISNAMKEDYSWKSSAKKYFDLYNELINNS